MQIARQTETEWCENIHKIFPCENRSWQPRTWWRHERTRHGERESRSVQVTGVFVIFVTVVDSGVFCLSRDHMNLVRYVHCRARGTTDRMRRFINRCTGLVVTSTVGVLRNSSNAWYGPSDLLSSLFAIYDSFFTYVWKTSSLSVLGQLAILDLQR